MQMLKGFAMFLGGLAAGAVAGALVAGLLAPQSGTELQGEIRERIEAAKQARVDAEAATAAELRERFRRVVNDPNALREQGQDSPAIPSTPPRPPNPA